MVKIWNCQLPIIIIIFLTGFSIIVRAEDTISVKNDTSYYIDLSKYLSVYVYGSSRFSNFEFYNSDDEYPVSYSPNENFNLGLGFSYKWMGLSAAFNFKFINNDDALYGTSSSIDLQGEISGRKTLWSGGFQSYSGYYWENIKDYVPNWNISDSIPIRSDISTFSLGVNGIYVLNYDKFSFRAAYSNSEWQVKSAGSWLIGGFATIYGAGADSSLIPHRLSMHYPVVDSVTFISAITVGGAAGYTHNWVIKKHFFINFTFFLGIALQASEALDINNNVIINDIRPAPKTHTRLAFGYNSKRSYYGMALVADGFFNQQKNNSQLNYSYGKVRFYYGYRFSIH